MSTTLEQVEKTAQLSKNNQLSLMVFQVQFPREGYEPPYYGMNVFKVREVLEGRAFEVSEMPEANPLIEGMVELRGVYLPVIDLPKWMGFDMTEEEKEKSIIIVSDFSHNFVGLRVAHIHGVEEKNWSDIKPASNYNINVNTNQVINHTYLENSDKLCFILDIEKLLIEAMPTMAEKIFSSAKSVGNESYDFCDQVKERTILFAEDSKAIQKYMGMVFEQLGLKYQSFDNGRLLLNYLDSLEDTSSVSMVFTDLEMPVASGHTVIKEIRQNKKTSALPIIVHTSMTSENNSREVLSMGADFFVGKVDTALIVETIKKVEEKYFA
ncbi:chemotaxis protein CheV [Hydrogenovibrio marinus]|uniref:Response regulator receiver protein n=1 Tax=Hydrogenovibrio marinus TaxID=28885 RepID=A0A066ZYQ7_HYDMR|nr:chemotaxis protein [Hydrogenovibrio marinus]KDN95205.1 response regulator receiver protein [Hydrogenovibrio marinus]BBN59680.1 chemotaxis protein CheV [Hydrogenovibrio marinus]